MAENVCEKSKSLSEASVLIRRIAEPREVGDSVKSAIHRAAKRLNFSFCRTHSIWYKSARRINADEMDTLRREANKQAERYERIAQAMLVTDQDFYREDIAGLVYAARALRGVDSA